MNQPMIDVAELRKVYGDFAVDGVSLSVAAGTIVGLLGPNGAGKTTIINCLTTLVRPDGGRVTVAGHDVLTDPDGVRSSIALTGQFAAVDDLLNARENLVLFGRLLGLPKSAARARADELLTRLDLVAAATKPVATFSGGMRRRLDLAISMVVERPVVFLDEPTTGLDPSSRQEVWAMVRQLRAAGAAVLLTTQYLEEADQLADQIIVINHGRKVAEGSPEELKKRFGGTVCEIRLADPATIATVTAALATVHPGVTEHDGVVTVPADDITTLAEVIRQLDTLGVQPADFAVRKPTLDDVFFALTGSGSESAAPAVSGSGK